MTYRSSHTRDVPRIGWWVGFNSSQDLRRLRKLAGLNQSELGRAAGYSRDSVCYWEGRIAGSTASPPRPFASTLRAWGCSCRRPGQPAVTLQSIPIPKTCGARTRNGTPCTCKPLPFKRRCKFHGGLSTGPKTQAGRDRIAEAQRASWADAGCSVANSSL